MTNLRYQPFDSAGNKYGEHRESIDPPEALPKPTTLGGDKPTLPTNPTEQFRAAVESALLNHKIEWQSWAGQRPEGDPFGLQFDPTAEALASIQASTVELFTRLVGEDAISTIDFPPDGPTNIRQSWRMGRNKLKAELRQDIDQLIKDLSK